ncbi:MAG: hypothetical protein R2779_10990 [Crocinitomicaceae bacterium]
MKNFNIFLKIFLVVTIFTISIGKSFGQMEFPEDMVKVKFSVEQTNETAYIVADVSVVPKWHINASVLPKGSFGLPTKFILNKSKDFQLVGGLIEPKPIEKYDELADENLAYHEGKFKIKQKIKVLSSKDFELSGSFNYQTCNEVKCLPDYTYEFKVKVKGVEGAADESSVDETIVPTNEDAVQSDVSNEQTTVETPTVGKQDKLQASEAPLSKKHSIWVIFGLSF